MNSVLPLSLQRQYKILCIYSFLWWACYSLLLVFQPLYLVSIGIPIWGIFLNGALGAFVSLVCENFWSKLADEYNKYKIMILIGNIFIAFACIFILFVKNIWMMLILTVLLRSGPFSDGFTTVLIYRISDRIELTNRSDKNEKTFQNLNTFAQYRKWGSLGWAMMLPLAGYIVDLSKIGINFLVGAIGLFILSLWLGWVVDERLIIGHKPELNLSKQPKIPLFTNFSKLIANRSYFTLLIASLVFSIALSMTYEVQGIYYSIFAHDSYLLVVLIYSVAAFAEWPTMSLMAKRVKHFGWEKMIVLAYLFHSLTLFMAPLILLFNGKIWWGYCIQIITGITFGIRQPSTTLGLYVSLENNQKSLGQSFQHTAWLFGAFLGFLLGAFISNLLGGGETAFYGIYWFATVVAILSGILFWITYPKK